MPGNITNKGMLYKGASGLGFIADDVNTCNTICKGTLCRKMESNHQTDDSEQPTQPLW